MANYYEILEVSETATEEEIRSAYIKQALLYHPDRTTPANESRFRSIAEAYFTLSDKSRRHAYDLAQRSASTSALTFAPSDAFSVDRVFGTVFDPLLKPELESRNLFYAPMGAAAGATLGGIIANIPGALFGTAFGWAMGSIRDRRGMSVYDAFIALDEPTRREILVALGRKMFASIM